jgi:hypothetical protein
MTWRRMMLDAATFAVAIFLAFLVWELIGKLVG